MNLNTMVSYSVTRDTIFDNATLGMYSWVDSSNNYYVTNTLRPNAGTKLYTYDINTEETTDTGASYLSSSEPSTTSGYWTIQRSANVYEDADLSEYGITMATSGFPDNEITVTYTPYSSTYIWNQWNVQPSGGAGSATWGNIGGTLSNQSDLNTALSGKESSENKATTISSSSTNTEYTGAKAVYDYVREEVAALTNQEIEDLLSSSLI